MDVEREDRRLCCKCVGEVFLRTEIQRRGLQAECFYCGGNHMTFSIGQMVDEIELALNEHYYRTAAEPSGMEYAMLKGR